VQLAEEVVQDTFWQVWRQAPRFDSERGTAKAWIMTIARSRALDALRRIEPNECNPEPEALSLFEASDDDIPPDLLVAIQQGDQLHAALASLDSMPRRLSENTKEKLSGPNFFPSHFHGTFVNHPAIT